MKIKDLNSRTRRSNVISAVEKLGAYRFFLAFCLNSIKRQIEDQSPDKKTLFKIANEVNYRSRTLAGDFVRAWSRDEDMDAIHKALPTDLILSESDKGLEHFLSLFPEKTPEVRLRNARVARGLFYAMVEMLHAMDEGWDAAWNGTGDDSGDSGDSESDDDSDIYCESCRGGGWGRLRLVTENSEETPIFLK